MLRGRPENGNVITKSQQKSITLEHLGGFLVWFLSTNPPQILKIFRLHLYNESGSCRYFYAPFSKRSSFFLFFNKNRT
jgi:hypothetical protein